MSEHTKEPGASPMTQSNLPAEEKEQKMSEVTCYRIGDKVVFRRTPEYIDGVIIGIACATIDSYQRIEKRRKFKVKYGRIGRSMWVDESSLGGIIAEAVHE